MCRTCSRKSSVTLRAASPGWGPPSVPRGGRGWAVLAPVEGGGAHPFGRDPRPQSRWGGSRTGLPNFSVWFLFPKRLFLQPRRLLQLLFLSRRASPSVPAEAAALRPRSLRPRRHAAERWGPQRTGHRGSHTANALHTARPGPQGQAGGSGRRAFLAAVLRSLGRALSNERKRSASCFVYAARAIFKSQLSTLRANGPPR